MCIRRQKNHFSPIVALLVVSFAISSWIDLYGVWVELPILVHILPEGWTLPSYLVMMNCVSVLSTITYTVINIVWPGNISFREVAVMYVIMFTGFLALVFMTFFWQHTVWIAGADRSLPVLVLVLFLSMVDATSCVVYMPYMARFSEIYMPAYIAGEEMGGLITGIVGLIQGAGGQTTCYNETRLLTNATSGENYTETVFQVSVKEPLFPPSVYFVFLACIMLLSMAAFSLLNFSSFGKKRMLEVRAHIKPSSIEGNKFPYQDAALQTKHDAVLLKGRGKIIKDNSIHPRDVAEESINCIEERQGESISKERLGVCCFISLVGSFLTFGVFPSIQSYSTLPYGALAYTLAIRIGSAVNPLGAFLAFFLPVRSLHALSSLTGFATAVVAFHLYLAACSPTPPLQRDVLGSVLVIVTGPLVASSFAYTRACIASILHTEGGHKALMYSGACVQIGSCSGGVLCFVLVNVLEVFTSIPSCA